MATLYQKYQFWPFRCL